MKLRKHPLILAACLLSLPAIAVPVQYLYSGVIAEVRDYTAASQVGTYASIGDRFSGSFYYDADAPFSYWIEPNRTFFQGPADAHTVSSNSITVTGSSGEVQLFDDYAGYPDNVFLASTQSEQDSLPPSMRGFASVIRLNFFQEIEGDKLPRELSLTTSGYPVFSVTGYSGEAEGPGYFWWGVHGYVDSMNAQPFPEPATGALAVLGLMTLAAVRKKSKAIS